MCRYCKEIDFSKDQLVHGKLDTGLLDMACTAMIHGNELHISVDDAACNELFYKKIKINYCPMCGEKLEA